MRTSLSVSSKELFVSQALVVWIVKLRTNKSEVLGVEA